jgi:hypothetical protein
MAHDPLAPYRKTPVPPTGGAVPPTGPEEYSAFGTKDRVRRLRIRSTAAPVNAPGYNILLNVISDGEQCTHFILVYSVLIVRVQGRNLQKLVYAIENEMADYIQEFDPDRWGKPKDETVAFIESIEVKVVEGSSPLSDTQH